MAVLKGSSPEPDEFEVSVFGPGYGESVVVHLGGGDWLINDSCIDKASSLPASLVYLDAIGVNPATHVKAVVASHWDDDHIRGIAETVRHCTSASFVCSQALSSNEFLTLVDAANQQPGGRLSSGLREFKQLIELFKDERSRKLAPARLQFAVANTVILFGDDGRSLVQALSPSTTTVMRSHQDIARLIPSVAENGRHVGALRPNDASVVLLVDFGPFSALLGGDLEKHSDADRGWSAAIQSGLNTRRKSSVYKVAHHGSATAHVDAIWTALLEPGPASVIAPWSRGRHSLPTDDQLAKVGALSKVTCVTHREDPGPVIRRHRVVSEMTAATTRIWRPLEPDLGHVRLRRYGAEPEWRVETTDKAVVVTGANVPGAV